MQPRNRRTIQVNQIRDNMRMIREAVDPKARVMAVVKADGYGHGAAETSRAALEGGAEMLAVATADEGRQLREAGISAPILVLGAVTVSEAKTGVDFGLIQTVCSEKTVRICETACIETGKQAEVHLKIDTGMGRIGIRTEEERDRVMAALEEAPHVQLTGAFTHFSDADDGEDGLRYTEEQFRKFLRLTEGLPEGILRHCANSAAIHRRPDTALDMVRAGISLYGYPPVETPMKLRPCMRWTAKISHIKEIGPGEYISYGRTYRTEKNMRIATVTCGYGDGYHRAAGGKAEVLIRGRRAKILGRICMDQMMADVTDIPEAAPEDEVILIGKDGNEEITAEEIAKWSGTISYEILLSCGSRVERIFEYGAE